MHNRQLGTHSICDGITRPSRKTHHSFFVYMYKLSGYSMNFHDESERGHAHDAESKSGAGEAKT
eukprot:7487866-Pyramimonas_sp.AAC.1